MIGIHADKDWGGCPKKLAARDAIVDFWHQKTGLNSIPANSQFWTMCGKSAENSIVIPECEFHQLTTKSFILPEQFFGVEIKPEYAKANAKLTTGNWFEGDISNVIRRHPDFRPAMINVDTHNYGRRAMGLVADVMEILSSRVSDRVLMAANVIMGHRFYRMESMSPEALMEILGDIPSYQLAVRNANWSMHRQYYEYDGTGNSSTTMGTFFLTKEPA